MYTDPWGEFRFGGESIRDVFAVSRDQGWFDRSVLASMAFAYLSHSQMN